MRRECKNCKHSYFTIPDGKLCFKDCSPELGLIEFEPIEKEIKPMDKKYRVKKTLYKYCRGNDLKEGTILKYENQHWYYYEIEGCTDHICLESKFVENNPDWFEEAREEETLEGILQKYRNPSSWNIEYNILKTPLTRWHNKEVAKQKIELLEEVIEWFINCVDTNITEHNIFRGAINDKISEFEKECK